MLEAIECTQGTHDEDAVLCQLFTRQMLLWQSGESGLITEITSFPKMKVLNVFMVAGKASELPELYDQVRAHAIASGCVRLTGLSTPTSSGICRDAGWKILCPKSHILGTAMYEDLI
jgi:hypothetical protein|tara:strand:- start:453 stop:803 length:351 start_codon:yes stop_codon:yes gene_type:complete